jgi:hypothetical protein
VRAEVPAIDERRHAHRHDDPRRSALEQLGARAALAADADREPRPRDLLEEAFEKRRHVAEPEREDQHQVLGPGDVLLRLGENRRQRAGVPVALAAQEREVQPCNVEQANLARRCRRGATVAVGQGVAEALAGRIGMALDDEDARGCHAVGGRRWHHGAVLQAPV